MPGLRNDTGGTPTTPQEQHFREQLADDAATTGDHTTVKFEGPIDVTDEDAGSDPYNRTGRFRRTVR